MRGQGRCRACGSTSILHALTVLDRTYHGTPAPMAVALKGIWAPKPVGTFEIYLCVGCGFTGVVRKDPTRSTWTARRSRRWRARTLEIRSVPLI
jgi:hypothetical protein